MTRPPIRAIALMLVGMSLIPTGDSAAKLMITTHGVPPFFVAWSRFVIGAAAAFLIVALSGHLPRTRLYRDPRIWLRAALIVCGILSILQALRTEPVANTFGAFFVGPIFSYLLAALLLREPVSPARTALLLAGFGGVLLVVQPGGAMGPGILWAVLAGLFYGAYLTANRWLSDAAPPAELLLSQLVIGALLTAPLGLPDLPDMSPAITGLTLASGLCSMGGNLLLVAATRLAPASQLAPFVYFQLVAATLLGWSVFGDLPGSVTLAGLGMICSAGFATLALRR